jgi:hypothetical protein
MDVSQEYLLLVVRAVYASRGVESPSLILGRVGLREIFACLENSELASNIRDLPEGFAAVIRFLHEFNPEIAGLKCFLNTLSDCSVPFQERLEYFPEKCFYRNFFPDEVAPCQIRLLQRMNGNGSGGVQNAETQTASVGSSNITASGRMLVLETAHNYEIEPPKLNPKKSHHQTINRLSLHREPPQPVFVHPDKASKFVYVKEHWIPVLYCQTSQEGDEMIHLIAPGYTSLGKPPSLAGEEEGSCDRTSYSCSCICADDSIVETDNCTFVHKKIAASERSCTLGFHRITLKAANGKFEGETLFLARKTELWNVVLKDNPEALVQFQTHKDNSGNVIYTEKFIIVQVGLKKYKFTELGHAHKFPEDWVRKIKRDEFFWECCDRICSITDVSGLFLCGTTIASKARYIHETVMATTDPNDPLFRLKPLVEIKPLEDALHRRMNKICKLPVGTVGEIQQYVHIYCEGKGYSYNEMPDFTRHQGLSDNHLIVFAGLDYESKVQIFVTTLSCLRLFCKIKWLWDFQSLLTGVSSSFVCNERCTP